MNEQINEGKNEEMKGTGYQQGWCFRKHLGAGVHICSINYTYFYTKLGSAPSAKGFLI